LAPQKRGILTRFRRPTLKNLSPFTWLACIAAPIAFSSSLPPAAAQFTAAGISVGAAYPGGGDLPDTGPAAENPPPPMSGTPSPVDTGNPDPSLPAAPPPALAGGNPRREGVPWTAEWHQQPFSRIGIGADVSLLGIGIKAATPLNQYFDVRGLINFFGYTSGRFEVDGFNIDANIHLASAAAAVDLYPYNSMWRLSGGLMFFNANRISATAAIVPGTSFSLNGVTYYSSTANPVTGSISLGLNTIKPEPMVSFGFGRFVPHSNRHWSFPSEFGIVYMGAPALTVTTAGTVCTDQAQTHCSAIGSTGNPVGQAFNTNLQGQLAKWRNDLNKVQFYPIFSFSVMYSFNIR